jgi:hypothetical protein
MISLNMSPTIFRRPRAPDWRTRLSALLPFAVQYLEIAQFEQHLRRSNSTAEARRTQRGRAATETAEYAKYAEGGTQTVLFSAYSVFRGSNPQGSCSQAANNLIYCSAEIFKRRLFSALQ